MYENVKNGYREFHHSGTLNIIRSTRQLQDKHSCSSVFSTAVNSSAIVAFPKKILSFKVPRISACFL